MRQASEASAQKRGSHVGFNDYRKVHSLRWAMPFSSNMTATSPASQEILMTRLRRRTGVAAQQASGEPSVGRRTPGQVDGVQRRD